MVQGGIEKLLSGFRIEVFDQLSRVFDVRKQHGDLLALAF